MAYTDESPATRQLLNDYANNLRATLGELGRLVHTAEIIKAQYDEEISPIITSWADSDLWPNRSNLGGASLEETKAQMVTWQSYLNTLLTDLGSSTHIGQFTSAAGAENLLGG